MSDEDTIRRLLCHVASDAQEVFSDADAKLFFSLCDGMYLGSLPREYRADYGTVMAAIASNALAFQYAAPYLQDTRCVATAACAADPRAFAFVSRDLLRDPELARLLRACHGPEWHDFFETDFCMQQTE
jgi:hypothetical protein